MSKIPTKRSLGPGEKPEVRQRYVHMLREDQVVWTAYLEEPFVDFDEVWYDVHVGKPMEVPEGSPAYMWDVAEGVSRKRIDVVGRFGDQTYIIEVKPIANAVALGQVTMYSNLFIEEFEVNGPVLALIIATSVDIDIIDTARRMKVRIITMDGLAM